MHPCPLAVLVVFLSAVSLSAMAQPQPVRGPRDVRDIVITGASGEAVPAVHGMADYPLMLSRVQLARKGSR
jgi:hypothetical protein